MIEVDLRIPDSLEAEAVIRIVEQVCASNDLTCGRKGTLVSYPGSIHWHFRRISDKGTLEITWWESENRLWFKVADGRVGKWIDEILPKLKQEIESSLRRP